MVDGAGLTELLFAPLTINEVRISSRIVTSPMAALVPQRMASPGIRPYQWATIKLAIDEHSAHSCSVVNAHVRATPARTRVDRGDRSMISTDQPFVVNCSRPAPLAPALHYFGRERGRQDRAATCVEPA